MREAAFEYAVSANWQGIAVEPAAGQFVSARVALREHTEAQARGELTTLWRRRRLSGGWEIIRRASESKA